MRNVSLAAALLAAALFAASPAWAGSSVSGSLSIVIQPPLVIQFSPPAPTIACNAAAGTTVAAIQVSGGNGNPATAQIAGGDTSDFAISGSNIVVGANGIAAANCGKTQNVTITATQQ